MKADQSSHDNYGLAQSYDNFSQLLKTVRKKAGFSATKIALHTSIHPNSQGFYENKQRDPSIDYLISYSCTLGISFWQLLTRRIELGDAPEDFKRKVLNEIGPLYQHIAEQSQGYKVTRDALPDDTAVEQQNVQDQVSACHNLLDKHHANPHIRVYMQTGSSMSPTVNDGDTLFVDSSKTLFTEGDLFVFKVGDIFNVKRVQFLPNGGIKLIADNAQYRSVDMNKEELDNLEILGKLVSSINHFDK